MRVAVIAPLSSADETDKLTVLTVYKELEALGHTPVLLSHAARYDENLSSHCEFVSSYNGREYDVLVMCACNIWEGFESLDCSLAEFLEEKNKKIAFCVDTTLRYVPQLRSESARRSYLHSFSAISTELENDEAWLENALAIPRRQSAEKISALKDSSNGLPQISVVLPVCNGENHLRESLDSVVNQTFRDIEIICVNNTCRIDSLSVLREYEKQDKRVIVIGEKNSAYGQLMNRAIARARGIYLCIVEADDIVAPDMLETLYMMSNNTVLDIVKCNYFIYHTQENIETNESYKNISSNQIFELRKQTEILSVPPVLWSSIYRLEALRAGKIHFSEEKERELADNSFYYNALCNSKSIIYINKALYYHRESGQGSSTVQTQLMKIKDTLDALKKNSCNTPGMVRAISMYCMESLREVLKGYGNPKNYDLINLQAKEILHRLDIDIIQSHFNLAEQKLFFEFASPARALSASAPKVLIYNWIPFDNPNNWGGGVTVYCRNLIRSIVRDTPGVTVYFISSGFAYDASRKDIYIRKIDNIFGDKCQQYEIVNSPVPAAQENLLQNPLVALESKNLKNIMREFIKQMGPFKAIHFNNIEGLSLDVLDLKKEFKGTKFIFSIHNYVPMCVTGSYYQRHNHRNCDPCHSGEDCMLCTRKAMKTNNAQAVYRRALYGTTPEKAVPPNEWIRYFGFDKMDIDATKDNILLFAKTATKKINDNCDSILAVSKRVYDIAADNGFDKRKLHVSYIGTEVAKRQIRKSATEYCDNFKLVFLGNNIAYEEKGYPWLLDALSQWKHARNVDIILTVKEKNHGIIYKKLSSFKSVKVVNGYSHNDLQWILEGCHLGLVPVLWEDNLPQIAIEMAAYGVPVLASSAGGASELSLSPLFRFEAGNSVDFLKKLTHLLLKPEDLQEYWKHHKGLVTMSAHWRDIADYYNVALDSDINISQKDYSYILREIEFLRKNVSV